MYVVKTLFDFAPKPYRHTQGLVVVKRGALAVIKPTCVVVEVAKFHKREEIGVASVVYLTSEMGYRNFCENCNWLLMIQATDSNFVPLRIFCGTEKCVK